VRTGELPSCYVPTHWHRTPLSPAIARRLHHCRDLGSDEAFDFLTWFECAPPDSTAFDELVSALRALPECEYVDREIDIRLDEAEG
jgi:hypothetical protein